MPADTWLTTSDYLLLEALLDERSPRGDPVALLIRSKLSESRVVLPEDIGRDVATIGSRVVFRVDGGPSAARRLIAPGQAAGPDEAVAITTPLGLGLLGMRVGSLAKVAPPHGPPFVVRIEDVADQPEASRRAGQPGRRDGEGAS